MGAPSMSSQRSSSKRWWREFSFFPASQMADKRMVDLGVTTRNALARTGREDLNKDNCLAIEFCLFVVKGIAQISTAPKEYSLDDDGSWDRRLNYTAGGPTGAFSWSAATNTVFADRIAATGENRLEKAQREIMKKKKSQNKAISMPKFAKANARDIEEGSRILLEIKRKDGKLRGLIFWNGKDRLPPTKFTDHFAANWSLNLIDGVNLFTQPHGGLLGICNPTYGLD